MKKALISAASAVMMILPSSAFGYSADTTGTMTLDTGVTNVSARSRMQMRLDQLMDASARMDDVRMGPSHPITHTGRPDRRGIETTTRSTSMQRGKVRHSTVKGYREMKADMMKRIQNGGMSSSSTSSSSSMDSSAGSY